MSYNGIGLQSVRGSATSGHVQKSLSSKVSKPGQHESRKAQIKQSSRQQQLEKVEKNRELAKKELLNDREKLRKIEVKCMDLRDDLEDQGLDDDEVEKKVKELRDKLTAEMKDEGKKKVTYEYKRLYSEEEPKRK
ncbi:CWC21 Pre-mRNA-splicing factor CWC21 [Candida maltosa Xu316]